MKNQLRTIIFPTVLVAIFSLFSISAEAQTGKTKKVRFAQGKSSIVLKGAIVRGTEDRYIVPAKKGQTMSVKITSLEKNANFTVYFAGEQESLKGSVEATKWTGKLSDDNNYVVVVGASRGNATYSLVIGIN